MPPIETSNTLQDFEVLKKQVKSPYASSRGSYDKRSLLMHKGFMLLLAFLLFHEYLDAFPAYLADNNMLGCGDTDSATVSFFCANQFAVNGIELYLRAIAKTADGNNTALSSYYHTMHLCRTDVVGRNFFDIFEFLPTISRLISCDVRNTKRTIRISIIIKRSVTSRRRIGIFTNYT
jgi:hypothetical protein